MKKQRVYLWMLPLAVFMTLAVISGCDKEKFLEPDGLSQEMDGRFSPGQYDLSIPQGERFLVGFHAEPDIAIVKAAGGEVYKTFTIVPAVAARLSAQAAEALAKNPKVRYVEPDHEVFAHSQTVPWGIDRVFGAETYSFPTWGTSTGNAIKVAILDTGIDGTHVDLTVVGGTTTVDNTSHLSDGSGHGTHVAGTVAALDNNLGVVGVAPDVALYAVKVLNDGGSGTVSSVVAGIDWAVSQDIRILNMSLGSSTSSTTLKQACDNAYAAGHLLVASAGNNGNPGGRGDNVGYPGAYESVIAVAASTINNTRSSFSSTGPAVELIAPGSNILSTLPGNKYGTYSGTSMASPHVAGVAALVWAANSSLKNNEVRQILRETAEDLGLSSNHQGHGLARADLAVAAVSGGEPPEPRAYSITASAGIGGTIEPSGEVKVNEGGNQTFTITPNTGYKISDVLVDNSSVGAVPSYTFENVKADHTIHAEFIVEGDGDNGGGELTIDKFELTNTSNPAWARVRVDWAVSGSNLATVKSELSLNGNLIDSVTSSVSGSVASGSHELRNRGGSGATYRIILTVTDTAGNSVSDFQDIGL
jgi:subtilisin